MKKILSLLSFALLLLFLQVNSSFACKCKAPDTPKNSLEKANSVFVGKVVDITNENNSNLVKFELVESYKWTSAKNIEITTNKDSATCWFDFEKDKSYIVYTKKYEDWKENVSLCSRTALLDKAKDDLLELSSLKKYYNSKEIFELAEWNKCVSASDWCNTFFMTNWKIWWGTLMACMDQEVKWSCLATNESLKEEFTKKNSSTCEEASDWVNNFINLNWEFVVRTKIWYPENFVANWTCIEEKDNPENVACTMQYDPVCWVDWVTYWNNCMAQNKKIAYAWECKKIEAKYMGIIDKIVDIYKQRLQKYSAIKRPAIHENMIKKVDSIIWNFKNNQTIADRLVVLLGKLRLVDVSKL